MALTGEGADEWLAGYPWYKVNRVLGLLDVVPGLPLSQWLRRALPAADRRAAASLATTSQTVAGRSAATTPGSTSTA